MQHISRSKRGLLLVVLSLVWLGSYYLLANHLGRHLPLALKKSLLALDPEGGGLQSWATLVWLVTGVPAAFAGYKLLGDHSHIAGVQRPSGKILLWGLLLAPVVLVLSSYIAWNVALDTIVEELAQGGSKAVHKNSGAFGRSLKKTPATMVIVWGVMLAPLAEELLFRGGLWSGLRELLAPRPDARPASSIKLVYHDSFLRRTGRSLSQWLRSGGLATGITSLLFAFMHWDMPGGVGLLRLTQTTCLGLALGELRHRSNSVWPCVLTHMLFNALSLTKLRKWWLSEGWPKPFPIPRHWWQLAAVCLALMAIGWWRMRQRSLTKEPSLAPPNHSDA